MIPITLSPGIIFDARSVILAMSGLFCGPWAAIIAAAMAGGYRIWLGGAGMGIGVSVIISSAALGLAYRYCRYKGWVKIGVLQFLLFGLLVHVVAVLLFAIFPEGIVLEVMQNVALPFILIFTPATAILGLLLQDIENRVKTEHALNLSESRYARVIEGSDQGFWDWDLKTQEFKVSPRYESMLGYATGEMPISPQDWGLHVDPLDLAKAFESIDQHCKGLTPSHELEFRIRTKSGEWKWILTSGKIVARDEAGKPLIMSGTHTDITARKLSEEKLQYVAHYDLLTGLPNRVLLADRLQQAVAWSLRRGDSLAVAYLDLDGFKEVNDRHGHDVGDALLIALAQRMKASMREIDTLARIGGDEFVAVLVDLDRPQDCEPALARLLQASAEPVTVGDIALQVSASIGVTLSPQDGGDADQLLRHANQAMYLAKQAGKNRYHLFDVDQAAAVEVQRESLKHIRRAMDAQEFVLHYQPKVNMKTGEVIGAEALIRWQHPERGLLPPAAFLPTIENHSFSVELGEWVIHSTLAQMTEWQAAGLNIPVSVNVGARQLQQADFALRLSDLLNAHPAVQPDSLELEILETSALDNIKNVSEIMYSCRKIGVRFALDDFGTGYSSLTYLKHLPADVLKIDQTFVRDMLDDADDLAIVEGVLGLANAFRRRAIAEGVETIAHGELLLSLGCEWAQGYAIARPMPASELPVWLATWRPDVSWGALHEYPIKSDERMVVFAEVKHHHWQREIEAFLTGERGDPPALSIHTGHFDQWLETDGQARYGEHPEFLKVLNLHNSLHNLGCEVVEMHIKGEIAEAQKRLGELHAMREELNAGLRGLVHDL